MSRFVWVHMGVRYPETPEGECPCVSDAPDLGDLLDEAKKAFQSVAKDAQHAFEKIADEAEYRFDKFVGRELAKHPDLVAELKRTGRQIQRTTKVFLDGLKQS